MNTPIDPVRESVEAIAAIKAPTINEVAAARGHDWRELYSKYVVENRLVKTQTLGLDVTKDGVVGVVQEWAHSPVVDMTPQPTDEIGVVVPDFHLEAVERFTRRGVMSISDLRAQHIADWEQARGDGLSDEQVKVTIYFTHQETL